MTLTTKIMDVNLYLTDKGIRPLKKRVEIYRYLNDNRNHPTADQIHSDLQKQISNLSKTTVYNILNLFVKEGIIKALPITNVEQRFDADMSKHGHFLCRECGEVFDFGIDYKHAITDLKLKNFRVDDYFFCAQGMCLSCLREKTHQIVSMSSAVESI